MSTTPGLEGARGGKNEYWMSLGVRDTNEMLPGRGADTEGCGHGQSCSRKQDRGKKKTP